MAADLKKCFKCGELKPRSEFYRHPQAADGLRGKCKKCKKKYASENYRLRREQYKAHDRKRAKTDHRKRQIRSAALKRIKKHPVEYRARYLAGNAIRDKRLVRQPCEVCGNPKTQAHHDDYSKPLDVRWLCFKHHREHHGQQVI